MYKQGDERKKEKKEQQFFLLSFLLLHPDSSLESKTTNDLCIFIGSVLEAFSFS